MTDIHGALTWSHNSRSWKRYWDSVSLHRLYMEQCHCSHFALTMKGLRPSNQLNHIDTMQQCDIQTTQNKCTCTCESTIY